MEIWSNQFLDNQQFFQFLPQICFKIRKKYVFFHIIIIIINFSNFLLQICFKLTKNTYFSKLLSFFVKTLFLNASYWNMITSVFEYPRNRRFSLFYLKFASNETIMTYLGILLVIIVCENFIFENISLKYDKSNFRISKKSDFWLFGNFLTFYIKFASD